MLTFKGRLLSLAMMTTGLLSAHIAFATDPVAAPGSPEPAPAPMPAQQTSDQFAPLADDPAPDAREVECVAKVIRHEAANQPETGQVAVAQVIRARMNDGRFPTTACGVVKQRGQFFDVDAYDPPRDDARWAIAMRIAIATLSGDGEEVADGALFFHSAGASMPGRVRVTRIADHTFYR